MSDLIFEELTDMIISCYYKVYSELGYGFLEKVYENAMMIELNDSQLFAENQIEIMTFYKGQIVGVYYADILVEKKVVIELKAYDYLRQEDYAQILHYLKATGMKVGLLMNFGKKPEFKRVVF
jgi:GxxExxY protein